MRYNLFQIVKSWDIALWDCLFLYKETITLLGNVIRFKSDYYVFGTKLEPKNFHCYHFRLGIETKVDVTVQHFSIINARTDHVVTPCDVCGAQSLQRVKSCDVSGWCDVCPL